MLECLVTTGPCIACPPGWETSSLRFGRWIWNHFFHHLSPSLAERTVSQEWCRRRGFQSLFEVLTFSRRTPLSGIGATCGAVSRVGASQKAEIFSSSTSRNRHTGCVQTALREVRSLNERVSLSLQPDSFSCESSGPKERTQYRDSVFSHSWEAGGW